MLLINKVKLLFIAFLAISLVTLIYIQTNLYSNKQHQNILRKLEQIDKNSVFLNGQVLKADKGLLRNHDILTQVVDSMEGMAASLKQEEHDPFKQNDIQHLEQILENLETSLESFLSINAILNNSLAYLPLLVNEFEIQSQNQQNSTGQVHQLLEQTFLYNRWHERERITTIERIIDNLLINTMSFEQDDSGFLPTIIANSRVVLEDSNLLNQEELSQKPADLLTTIIIHTQVILEYSNLIDQQIKSILTYTVSDTISLIRQQYLVFSTEKLQKAEYLSRIIYVIAFVLLIMLINFFLTLRYFSRSLLISNERLKSEVKHRTTAESRQKTDAIFLQTILDNISDGIVVCDNEGKMSVFNKAAEKIYGQGLTQVGTEQWAQQYRMYDRHGLKLLKKEQLPLYITLSKGSVENVEVMVKPVSATAKILLINGTQLLKDNGEKQGAVICIRDITERKKNDTEMRLAATAFEAHEAIMIVDADCNIVRVNKKFVEITGYSVEDVISHKAEILQSDKHNQVFYQKLWKDVYEKGFWQGEIYSQRKNGDDYQEWMSLSVVRDEDNEITHYISHFRDITEYKQYQELIKRHADEERVVAEILHLSFLSMQEFLKQFAEIIVSLPWLKLEPKCGICLNIEDENSESYALFCNQYITRTELTMCLNKWLDKYISTGSVHSGDVHFNYCIDTDEGLKQNIKAHNHYYVPIKPDSKILGVVVLFLPVEHEQEDYEVLFLKRIAGVLSLGISRKQAEEKVENLAYHDGLTGLPNRMLLMNRLEQVVSTSKRRNRYAALMYIDFDKFKNINDSLGHSVGDSLLQQVAQRFKSVLRQEDTVARIGGDEFVVLLTEIPPNRETAITEVQLIANKLHKAIAKEIIIQNRSLFISLSLGIVIITGNEENTESIMVQADTAMYQAKENGRNGTQFFMPEMQTIAMARLELEKDLRSALKHQQLHVFYQPQTNLNGELVGAEALIRWMHPQRGIVAPNDFISIAEESRIMLDIGHFVLEDACKKIKLWQDFPHIEHIAVNISPFQFRQPDFVASIERVISKVGIDTTKLTLELTEAILNENVEDAINKMQGLKSLGIGFSIDDFGTGYSSLANLIRFPIDQLKIDKSFVDDMGTEENNRIVIKTIIAMADRLGLNLIAEGVETREQINFLKEQGCSNYQGYYFSEPLTSNEFTESYL